MTVSSMQFGELTLAFTTRMSLKWSSQKSGGDYKASFYQPKPPSGFHALGHVGHEGYEDDGNIAALCVMGTIGNGKDQAPLAHPTGYERVWQDKGTDGKYSGACWRPIAPSGYVALGHLFEQGHDTMPKTTDIVCVRKNLAYLADYDEKALYGTAGTDANHRFHAYKIIIPKNASPSETHILIAALTFFGKQGGGAPTGDPALWVLNLPIVDEVLTSPTAPAMTATSSPPDYTEALVDRIAYVPFTGVKDNDPVNGTGEKISVNWQVKNSPFYAIKRLARYHKILYYYNQTSLTQTAPPKTVTVGVSSEHSETFSVETGIEVGYETGVSVEGQTSKLSVKLGISLGFSVTRSFGEFLQDSFTLAIDVPSNTAVTLYIPHFTLQLVRDAGHGETVGKDLPFNSNDNYVSAQYPPTG